MNRKSTEVTKEPKSVSDRASILALGMLAFFSILLYGVVTWLSPSFEYYEPNPQRPLLLVLALIGGLFFLYLVAIRVAARANPSKDLIWMVVGSAVVFRVIVVFSTPIQEVDIYRYVWDGIVCSQGISPFRFPPAQVNAAVELDGFAFGNAERDLRTLVKVTKKDPAIRETLKRVHFGQLPTVYPPVSQAIFAMAALATPENATLTTRLRLMKIWLIGFDLATLFLVIKLLSLCRLPVGLSLIYAWCPLLMKEVANSGHLDTIAVFLTTLFVYGLVKLSKQTSEFRNLDGSSETPKLALTRSLAFLGFVLAAAVGAKLYPLILMPVFFLYVMTRFGWRNLIVPGMVFLISTAIFIWPMLPSRSEGSSNLAHNSTQDILVDQEQLAGRSDPSLGIQEFLKTWEINDFIFMVIVENLKPAEQHPGNRAVWFSVLPDQMRASTIDLTESALESIFNSLANGKPPVFQKYQLPFFVTRLVTMGIYLCLYIAIVWRLLNRSGTSKGIENTSVVQTGEDESIQICQTVFLIIAWFWLLCPTQNPWYWIWAMPLLPFMRNRAWLAVSGLVMMYYLRFWFGSHFEGVAVLGSDYQGTAFFDFIVPWIEFGPWFVWLAISGWLTRQR